MVRLLVIVGLLCQSLVVMPADCAAFLRASPGAMMMCPSVAPPLESRCCGASEDDPQDTQRHPDRAASGDCTWCPLPTLPVEASARLPHAAPLDPFLAPGAEPGWAPIVSVGFVRFVNVGRPPGAPPPSRILHCTWVI